MKSIKCKNIRTYVKISCLDGLDIKFKKRFKESRIKICLAEIKMIFEIKLKVVNKGEKRLMKNSKKIKFIRSSVYHKHNPK